MYQMKTSYGNSHFGQHFLSITETSPQKKMCMYFYFLLESAEQCTHNQQITSAMSGFSRLLKAVNSYLLYGKTVPGEQKGQLTMKALKIHTFG